MAKPLVLIIHGMGTHDQGSTEKEIIAGINETAAHFGKTNFDVKNKVDFVEFNYSKTLDEIRLRDAKKADEILAHLGTLPGHVAGQLVAKFTELFADFDKDKALYSHWLDVAYYGLFYWGEMIRVDLAKALNDVIDKANTEGRYVHVIAHSLGTAILHDTLAKLYRRDVDIIEHAPSLDVVNFKLESIWMVANVSKMVHLLNDIADPDTSIVSSDHGGCTKVLYNVRNEFDPFTWFKSYKRPITNGGQHIETKIVREVNTHDLTEYMATPEVTALFLRKVLHIDTSVADYNAGIVKHAESSINSSYEEIKEAVDDIRNKPDESDKFAAIIQLVKAVIELKDKLEDLKNGGDDDPDDNDDANGDDNTDNGDKS